MSRVKVLAKTEKELLQVGRVVREENHTVIGLVALVRSSRRSWLRVEVLCIETVHFVSVS